MPEETPAPNLSLSVTRRLAHLRPWLARILKAVEREPATDTVTQYRAAAERMEERRLWPEEIGARSRRSFNLYRAALVFVTVGRIREDYCLLRDPTATLSTKAAHDLVSRIETGLAILCRYPPEDRESPSRWARPERGMARQSKRRGLARLPIGWRETMAAACPGRSHYYPALLVAALTGLRPSELQKGVAVRRLPRGHISVQIHGAKVTETTGQPVRCIAFKIDSPVAHRLGALMAEQGESGRLGVSVADPRKFCDFMRGLSRRLFPRARYVASPYSFRHAFAADQKAQGASVEALAQMLGHVSGRSQRAYGHANQGRQPLAHIVAGEASRPVRAVAGWVKYAARQDRNQNLPADMALGC